MSDNRLAPDASVPAGPPPAPAKVPMTSPEGKSFLVPADKVSKYQAKKWKAADAAPAPASGASTTGSVRGAEAAKVDPQVAALRQYNAQSAQLPWRHIPGAKDDEWAAPGDGGVWDKIKQSIPAQVRDTVMGVTEAGAVWTEPSDDEVDQNLSPALRNNDVARQQYKDDQWAMALDAAKGRGKAIYRGSRIHGATGAPDWLLRAQAVAETVNPLAAFGRGVDRTATLGAGGAASDLEWGMGPVDAAAAKAASRENIKESDRNMAQHRVFATGGAIAGGLIPAGAFGRIAKAADLAMGANAGRSVAGSVMRGAGSAAGGSAVTSLATDQVSNAARGYAGMDAKPVDAMLGDAAIAGLIAAPIGGALAVPGAVSRSLRGAGDENAQALQELGDAGGRTSVVRGLDAPPGSEALAQRAIAERAPDATRVARDVASEGVVPTLEQEALAARAGARTAAGAEGYGVADQLLVEADSARAGLREAAGEVVDRGVAAERAADVAAARVSGRMVAKLGQFLPAQSKALGEANEAALREEAQNAAVLEAEGWVSGTSTRPLIEKYGAVFRKLSWEDESALLPNSQAEKFRSAAKDLTVSKTVPASDVAQYRNAALHISAPDADGLVTVQLPKQVNARELDNFIQAADDQANYQGKGGPESAIWKDVGATARQMRDDFAILKASKDKASADIIDTERMLEATGLGRGAKLSEGAEVSQTTQVMNQLKGILNDADVGPDAALRRPVLEKWLAGKDPGLFEEYLTLRKLHSTAESFKGRGITAKGVETGESLERVISVFKGDVDKFEAFDKALGAGPKAIAARAEHARVDDVFTQLGAKPSPETAPSQRIALREKLYDTLVSGGAEYDTLAASLKPAQRAALEPVRKAAVDADKAFQTLGLKPGKWSTAQSQEITDGMNGLLTKFRSNAAGGGREFDKAVEEAMRTRPALKSAVIAFRGEVAWQKLATTFATKAGVAMGGKGYMRGLADAATHRLDALMGPQQAGKVAGVRTPFGAPTEYAIGVTEGIGRDQDAGAGPGYMTAKKMFEFFTALGKGTRQETR